MPGADAGGSERDNAARDRDAAHRIDLHDALGERGRVRNRARAERLARREVDDGVHRQMVARVQRDAEVAGVVLLPPLDRASVGQAHQAGARLRARAELRAVLERLEAGDSDRAILPDVVARGGGAQLRLDGHDRRLERGDEARDHVRLHRHAVAVACGGGPERSTLAPGELRPGLAGVHDQFVVNREDAVRGGEASGGGRDVDGRVASQHRARGRRLQGLRGERIDRRVHAGGAVDCSRIVSH